MEDERRQTGIWIKLRFFKSPAGLNLGMLLEAWLEAPSSQHSPSRAGSKFVWLDAYSPPTEASDFRIIKGDSASASQESGSGWSWQVLP